MEITTKKLKLSQIKPNPTNPRKIGKVEMERLVKSLQDFPEMMELREIIVDENNIILGGNMRYRALKQIGEKECVAKIVTGLTVDQKREFIIKDNSNFGSYDMDALANLWSDLPLVEWGVDLPDDWLNPIEEIEPLTPKGNLADRFGIPPFSVLNAREGWWQDRKAAWIALGIKSELGRGEGLLMTADQVTTENLNFYRNRAAPGGSARPACDYSKNQRGDGRGRPIT